MIKTIITGSSQYIKVHNTPPTYVSPYTSAGSVAGAMRFNPNGQHLEVYDGNNWQNVTGHSEIGFTNEMIELLDWAKSEMNKQKEMKKWALTHPTLQSALADLQSAQDKANMVWLLCQEHEHARDQDDRHVLLEGQEIA